MEAAVVGMVEMVVIMAILPIILVVMSLREGGRSHLEELPDIIMNPIMVVIIIIMAPMVLLESVGMLSRITEEVVVVDIMEEVEVLITAVEEEAPACATVPSALHHPLVQPQHLEMDPFS